MTRELKEALIKSRIAKGRKLTKKELATVFKGATAIKNLSIKTNFKENKPVSIGDILGTFNR